MFGAIGDLVGTVVPFAGGAVGVAGTVFGFWKRKQLGAVVKEVFDVIREYRKAKEDGKFTEEEIDKLINELEEAVKAIVKVIKVG